MGCDEGEYCNRKTLMCGKYWAVYFHDTHFSRIFQYLGLNFRKKFLKPTQPHIPLNTWLLPKLVELWPLLKNVNCVTAVLSVVINSKLFSMKLFDLQNHCTQNCQNIPQWNVFLLLLFSSHLNESFVSHHHLVHKSIPIVM